MRKPTYVLISEKLTEDIQQGVYKSGEKLPTEYVMAKHFNVSRETFRSAIKLLENRGVLVVKHGVGTFVTKMLPTIPSSLETLSKISDLIKSAGLKEGERKDFSKVVDCEPEWAEKLEIPIGKPVTVHQRIRMANNEPVVLSQNIMDNSLIGDAFEKKELYGSLTEFLEKECNIKTLTSDSELIVPLHTDKLCQKLLLYPETTVLLMEQLHYNELNEPVMYSRDYFRNDVFQFKLRRKRKGVE
ncbi:GntR family transcriptional regulator [Gracilibacillus alcaliphilus]|uniref:GntR family transcriptional regulator n=1 Tax=Gracilibacillus alcaliphilus TaxID=1401441 RepID=UPI00195CE303|nr:GntR family transcriptional regulator [Gracilibacillus alcaliphilus]MBM7677724.1 GntR family transcriptional regulator [Gracilibacillus alcaliphilus]